MLRVCVWWGVWGVCEGEGWKRGKAEQEQSIFLLLSVISARVSAALLALKVALMNYEFY